MTFDRKKLKSAIYKSVCQFYQAQNSEVDLYRNTLDCFSAAIDAVVQGISLDEWMTQEHVRQVQKTKQNIIGTLHEVIIGSLPGFKALPIGNVVDIINEEKKIIAEIKNKFNTTKGNHRIAVYDGLASALQNRPNYTAYFVEILPRNRSIYNEPFTPSDNTTKTRRPKRNDIRLIDGYSFYELITGNPNAIAELYKILPGIVTEIINESYGTALCPNKVLSSKSFTENFEKAYELKLT